MYFRDLLWKNMSENDVFLTWISFSNEITELNKAVSF